MSPTMTVPLPSSHPILDALDARNAKCPVSGSSKHRYRKPLSTDLRGVCPALNTMANHGYIPRNGRNLSFFTIVCGLVNCYNLSYFLALFLTAGGFLAILKFRNIDLHEVGRHNRVEHDASLCHRDTSKAEKYGPRDIVPEWAEEIIGDIQPKVSLGKAKEGSVNLEQLDGVLVNERDIAQARVRRERLSPTLDPIHAEIARGEMAIILGVWETRVQAPNTTSSRSASSATSSAGKLGIPFTYLLNWLVHERLPDDWKPTRVMGLRDTMKRARAIKQAMEDIRAKEKASAKTK